MAFLIILASLALLAVRLESFDVTPKIFMFEKEILCACFCDGSEEQETLMTLQIDW